MDPQQDTQDMDDCYIPPNSNNALSPSNPLTKFSLQDKDRPLYRPEFGDKDKNEQLWELMGQYLGRDIKSIQKSIVQHVEYTLAMTRFNFSNFGCCQAVAYSLRDRMIECFNDTNQYYLHNDVKRLYFLSMEYILGRQMQNNLLNNDLEQNYREALKDIGYDLTQMYEEEIDINLGYGVLGRLASDSIDSLATQNVPCWAYGLRFDYGIFRQNLVEGEQVEVPDYWLERGNPWEIERPDITYQIRMYGKVTKKKCPNTGVDRSVWEGGDCVYATAYDMPITGYNTFNTNNLRLWRSRPYDEFDESLYVDDPGYEHQIEKCQDAEYITSIFYPNDKVQGGKELRLKQQYFYVASTLQDIVRRFKKHSHHSFDEFDKKNAIHLHETHSAIAILEMLRILIDEYTLPWQQAWNITYHTFTCALFQIKESQMEKWPLDMFSKLLPRHLELLTFINQIFLDKVKQHFPQKEHDERLRRMSIIEDGTHIRIANLCLVACHKIILCSQLQFDTLTQDIFRDFYTFLPKAFTVIPNGANPRRWIFNANRELSRLITEEIGDEQDWLVELDHLKAFSRYTDDLDFLKKFLDIRAKNKWRLLNWLKKKITLEEFGRPVGEIVFDIMVKRVDENKRQLMYLMYIIYRYNWIKSLEDRSQVVPRFHFIGGKTAIGNQKAKQIVKLINQVAQKINSDPETKELLRIIFIPNYNASKEHIVVPAADFNEQLTLPGEEACTTISEKFLLNGALIIGSRDSTNTKVSDVLGQDTITIFGPTAKEAKLLRQKSDQERRERCSERFRETVAQVLAGEFGQCHQIVVDTLQGISEGRDPYLVGVDFEEYIKAQEEIDSIFKNRNEFCRRIMTTMSNLGNLQIDKTIKEMCDKVWKIPSVEVPKPALNAKHRVRSSANLLSGSQEFNQSKESVNEMEDA